MDYPWRENLLKKGGLVVFCNEISTVFSSYVFTHRDVSFLIVWYYLLLLFLIITPQVD